MSTPPRGTGCPCTPPWVTGCPHLPRVRGVHTSKGYKVSTHTPQGYGVSTPPRGTGCPHSPGDYLSWNSPTSTQYTSPRTTKSSNSMMKKGTWIEGRKAKGWGGGVRGREEGEEVGRRGKG